MKKITILLILGMVLGSPIQAHAGWEIVNEKSITNRSAQINHVSIEAGDAKELRLGTTESTIINGACLGNQSIYFDMTDPLAKYFYAIGLAAKLSGISVQITAECDEAKHRWNLLYVALNGEPLP